MIAIYDFMCARFLFILCIISGLNTFEFPIDLKMAGDICCIQNLLCAKNLLV